MLCYLLFEEERFFSNNNSKRDLFWDNHKKRKGDKYCGMEGVKKRSRNINNSCLKSFLQAIVCIEKDSKKYSTYPHLFHMN